MRERSQHDYIYPALQVMSDIAQLFSRIEPALRLIDEERDTTQACHARLERQPRAQRWFLKEHYQLFTGQCSAEISRTGLHESCEFEHGLHFARSKIANGNQIAAQKALRAGKTGNR